MENKICLINRKELSIYGISKVFAINQDFLQLQIENSVLVVYGKNMEVKKLDVENGQLQVEGIVDNIKYVEKKEKGSFLKRIFK